MLRKRFILFVILIMMFSASACSASALQPPLTLTPTQTLKPISTLQPVSTQTMSHLPLSEAEVPRVSVQDVKAALDGGEAIVVDVRSADDYAAGHIVGAINIPLTDIESNPASLNLDKNQWIITYCT
jgi:3-mercaptopyruvate sulfurtransferase SseA